MLKRKAHGSVTDVLQSVSLKDLGHNVSMDDVVSAGATPLEHVCLKSIVTLPEVAKLFKRPILLAKEAKVDEDDDDDVDFGDLPLAKKLLRNGRVPGVMRFTSYAAPSVWESSDMRSLSRFAQHLGAQKAGLTQQVTRSVRELDFSDGNYTADDLVSVVKIVKLMARVAGSVGLKVIVNLAGNRVIAAQRTNSRQGGAVPRGAAALRQRLVRQHCGQPCGQLRQPDVVEQFERRLDRQAHLCTGALVGRQELGGHRAP